MDRQPDSKVSPQMLYSDPTYTKVMIQAKIDLLNTQINDKIKQVWQLTEVKAKLSRSLEK